MEQARATILRRPPSGEARAQLARFLRLRREAISPEDVGLPRHGRRRTPGLRRDEVAVLADISAAWYSRLEMGHEVKPSADTLLAIARALRLDAVETEYVFAIAGVALPRLQGRFESALPEDIEQLVLAIGNVAMFVMDDYLTPLRWNAIADGVYRFSKDPDPFARNTIIRLCAGKFEPFYDDDYDDARRAAVGMFRRAYLTNEPTSFARLVYETARRYPVFEEFWEKQVVEDDFVVDPGPRRLKTPLVGPIRFNATGLKVVRHPKLHVRFYTPADDATAEKFERLRELGSPSTRTTLLP